MSTIRMMTACDFSSEVTSLKVKATKSAKMFRPEMWHNIRTSNLGEIIYMTEQSYARGQGHLSICHKVKAAVSLYVTSSLLICKSVSGMKEIRKLEIGQTISFVMHDQRIHNRNHYT